jgi:NADPH2:quinone reductase
MEDNMKAVRVHKTGGPEVMTLEEVATQEPAAGQAVVKLTSIGVNFIDIYQRDGRYPMPLPFTPGQEAAGEVVAVGEGVEEVSVGDRVVYCGAVGSYAEYAVVEGWRLIPIPEGLSDRIAAALILQGLTVHYLTHSTYPLKPCDTCLIHAAAGGVGLLFIQIAKRLGARVIGTVSTEEKAELARSAGADEVILYTEQDFETEVRRLTDGKGLPVVYDSVGKTTFDKSLNCLSPRGYLVLFGQASGVVPPLNPQVLNAKGSLFLTRPTLNDYTLTREELFERADDILGWSAGGELDVRIGAEFPLAEAAEAHRQLGGRQTTGKVLLVP